MLAKELSETECQQLIAKIESLIPSLATINAAVRTNVNTSVRNNERVIFGDPIFAEKFSDDASDHCWSLACGFRQSVFRSNW